MVAARVVEQGQNFRRLASKKALARRTGQSLVRWAEADAAENPAELVWHLEGSPPEVTPSVRSPVSSNTYV